MTIAFSLATLAHGGGPAPAIEVAGRYWLLKDVAGEALMRRIPRGLVDLFADWDRNFEALSDIAARVDKLAAHPLILDVQQWMLLGMI